LAQTSVTANAQIASSIFSNKFKALDDMLSLENIAKQLDSAIASTLPDMSNYADVSFEPFPNNSDLLTDDEDASIETVMVSESEMTQGEEFPSEPEYLSSNRTLLEGDTAISFESNSQNTFNFLVEKDPFSRDYPNLDEDLDVVTNDWPEVQMEPSAEDLRLSTIIEPTEETFGDVVINEHHTLDLNESNIGFIQRDELEVCSEIAPETSDFDIQELEKMSIDYGDIKIAPQKQNKTVQPSLLDDDIDIELDAPSVISEEYLNAKSSSFDALFGVGKSPIHQQEHKITQPESPKNSIERAFVAHKITDPQLDVNKSSSKTKPKIQNDWGKQTIAYGASLIPEELVATSDEVTTSTSQTASKEDHSVFEPNDESSDILALGPDDLVDDSLEPIDVPGQVDVISAESLIPAEILTKKDLLPDEDSDPVHSLKHGDKLSEVAPLSEHDLEQGGRPSGGHPAPFIEERKHSRSDEHHVDFDAFSRGFFDAPVSELQSEHDAEILAMAQQQKEEARQILNRILVIAPMILLGVAIMLWGIHYTVTQSKQQQQTLTSDDDPLTIDYKSRKPGTSQTEKPINKSLPSLPIPDVTPTPSTQIPEDTDASTTDVSMNKPVVEDRITPPPPIAEKPAIETRITPPPPIAEKPVVETRITPPPPPIAEKPVVETRITPSEKTTKTPIPPTKPKVAIAPPPKRKILRTPKRPKANRALAIRYYKEAQKAFFGGNLNTALRLSQLSIRADNRYPDAYLTQGLTYMRMQKKPQARATLQRFLKLAPKHQNAAMVKGLIGQLN
jgi:tetratricopeptide (TPR) repeat protein